MGLNASDEVTLDAPRLTYANIGLFHPELFAEVPRATKLKLFPWGFDLVRAGRVRGGRFRGGWHNIGTADDLALANASTLRPA
jgi:MurNAc alpha-1-phosphate uridylyltransferase